MSPALAIDLAPTEPIARQITRALRQAIVTMRLRPGEMLSEQDIATRFGVSRQPVREAFIKLGEAGLIQVLPQRGTLVVKISRAAVEDARFIREAVECALVREAAGQPDPSRRRDPEGKPRASAPRRQRRRTRKRSSRSTRNSTASWLNSRVARRPGGSSKT